MNLASRLNRLEKRLGPPPEPNQYSILLALALTKEELKLLERRLMQGESFEEMHDIHRRVAVIKEELTRESKPPKIAGEL
jgi:hypothetical protein